MVHTLRTDRWHQIGLRRVGVGLTTAAAVTAELEEGAAFSSEVQSPEQ